MAAVSAAPPSLTANALAFRSLLAVVILAPLPLACNRPWSWSLLSLLIGLIAIAWGIAVLAGRATAPLGIKRLWPACAGFAVAAAWCGFQSSSLAPAVWQHPIWQDAAHALGLPGQQIPGAISLDPEASVTALMRLLAYGVVFFLGAQLGRERTRAREALAAIALAGVAYAAYGLVAHLGGAETILWFPKWAYIGDLTSTFVNRNAYGAYAGVGYLCCIALFANGLRDHGHHRRPSDIAELLLLRTLPYLGGATLVVTALILSHSRAALACTGLGLVVLLAALVAVRVIRARAALFGCLGILIIAGTVFLVSGDATAKRFMSDGVTDAQRENIYRLSATALSDAPLTGFGLGTFTRAFSMYRDASLPQPQVFEEAHNVHLETAMDLGIPAAIALYVALGYVIAVCLGGLRRRRRDQVYAAVALGAAALLGTHGLVDFSLQMPAVAVTFSLLLGIGFAQSWNTAEHGGPAEGAEGSQSGQKRGVSR